MKFNLTGVSYLCLLLATLTAQANPKVVPPSGASGKCIDDLGSQ